MKKLLLSLSVAMLGLAAQAQNFKPVKGDVTTEFGLTGGINNTNFNLNDGAGLLRFRYFQKNDVAFRLGFNVGSTNKTNNVYGTGANEGKEGFGKLKATEILINLGIEKHFAGTDRLSPYVGADILFGTSTSKANLENATGTVQLPVFTDGTNIETKFPSTTSIGLRGVVGADYYIAKRLFLGVEAGLGFAYKTKGKSEQTTTINNVSVTTKHKSAGNSYEINPSVITGVRVGFAF
ncbi:MAG: hypothetical protein P0Y49_00905 [Candidatus Pedobacter colombiensis]|uniref:Outer membrane protein beta-barrel domain-containing protein n=1 Tax=Candidatus Pedobacter colombiensis TaxID=3121371 RepID=A0AAJ5W8T9_9SPHI|nr:hypothetical protein [Pedobacter sp.]WEK19715.1 MAG: hypothetical protein P0Y49_00905 [Pedobacter sp.]